MLRIRRITRLRVISVEDTDEDPRSTLQVKMEEEGAVHGGDDEDKSDDEDEEGEEVDAAVIFAKVSSCLLAEHCILAAVRRWWWWWMRVVIFAKVLTYPPLHTTMPDQQACHTPQSHISLVAPTSNGYVMGRW